MYLIGVIAFYFFNGFPCGTTKPTPMVKTDMGTVIGYYAESYGGRIYSVYHKIPYAMSPTGPLRFQPPQPLKKWANLLYTTKPSAPCIQHRPQFGSHEAAMRGEEDCLYLNIYVSPRKKNQLLPVLFTIHGGAFRYGNAINDPFFIMDKDVIVVSINYRVGIFGFLSTEDEHIPGNMGLKDQSMALRWTYENIQKFGGDPKRITLVGNSAGAESVHFHYLSPLSKGLFQNGISFSGTSLGAGNLHGRSLEKFLKVGDMLNCPTKNISETVECLRNRPANKIVESIEKFTAWHLSPLVSFGPVVEKDSKDAFIDRSPIDIISNGDVADALWINGVVSVEGLVPASSIIDNDTSLHELDSLWNRIVPHLLMYNYTIPLKKHDYCSKLIRNQYFGEKKISKHETKALISLFGDRLHYSSARRAAKLQAKANKKPVLFWYYSYKAETSCSDYYLAKPRDLGVCHGDDIFLMYGISVVNPIAREKDRAVQLKLLDMLVSLADQGYPNLGQDVIWEKVNPDTEELEMLHFSNINDIKMESRENFGQYKFWDTIM